MVRVAIDPHMFGESWFADAARELLRSSSVTFSYSGLPKAISEISRRRDALNFFKHVGSIRRREDANADSCGRYHSDLTNSSSWRSNSQVCDDGHIFALVRALPTKYVFSCDDRLAKCRDCLSGSVDASYLRFSVIHSERVYAANKKAILRL